MNRNTNNLTRMIGNQQTGPDYSDYLSWFLPHQGQGQGQPLGAATLDAWTPLHDSRLLLGLAGFPRPSPPLQFLLWDEEIPSLRPRAVVPFAEDAWTTRQEQYCSRLTEEEQKAALQKLKKEIYNPMPRIISKRLSLFYQDNQRYHESEQRNKEQEETKRCAICLDDFESREQVVLTPCNHMFHEDCIVPWVRSHGQCPVCRFAICDRMKQQQQQLNNNNNMPLLFF